MLLMEQTAAHLDALRRRLLLRFFRVLNALLVSGLARKITFGFLNETSEHLPDPHTWLHPRA